MKFTLDSSSLEKFNKNKQVEIEGFYSPETIQGVNQEIDQLLSKFEKPDEMMAFGRDLFQKSPSLYKALQLTALGRIIYELIAVRPLRFACDQLLVAALDPLDQDRASNFLKKSGNLRERSCLSEVVLGAMIALKAEETEHPFSGTSGNIVFFDPDIPIPVEWLNRRLNDRYWLLTFTTAHSQYIFNDLDPQNHYLKRLGYVYGDKLKDSLSPIILR